MTKKSIISGGINRSLRREPGFTPEDLARDDFKASKVASKLSVKIAKKQAAARAKSIKKLGA